MGKGSEGNINIPNKESGKNYNLEDMTEDALRSWGEKVCIPNYDTLSRSELVKALEPFSIGILDPNRPNYFPLEDMEVTVKEIRQSIPKHCFNRSLFHSFRYLITDLLIVGMLGYLATFIEGTGPAKYVLWPLYWYKHF